jgi:hypothetical protein
MLFHFLLPLEPSELSASIARVLSGMSNDGFDEIVVFL